MQSRCKASLWTGDKSVAQRQVLRANREGACPNILCIGVMTLLLGAQSFEKKTGERGEVLEPTAISRDRLL